MNGNVFDAEGIAPTITTNKGEGPKVAIIKQERNEYGKQIRKAYESGEIMVPRKEIKQYVARDDGITNTITTVEKDNYLMIKNADTNNNEKTI